MADEKSTESRDVEVGDTINVRGRVKEIVGGGPANGAFYLVELVDAEDNDGAETGNEHPHVSISAKFLQKPLL